MDHSDVVNLVIASATLLAGVVIGFTSWLWKHSSRLTANEVQTEEIGKRLDRHEQHIYAALTRIEDKLDRKVDR